MGNLNIIGKQIRKIRIERGLTQSQLATILQLNDFKIERGGVAKLETGVRRVTDIELVKIAQSLMVTVNYLLADK